VSTLCALAAVQNIIMFHKDETPLSYQAAGVNGIRVQQNLSLISDGTICSFCHPFILTYLLTYIRTYLFTPWCRILFEKL